MLGIFSKYKNLSDDELVSSFRKKPNTEIIGEIYKRYGHLVMGTAMKYLKNVQEAEDLTMNLFEKIPDKLNNHEIKHFKSWMYMVTKNECLMQLRKKKNIELDITELQVPASEDNQVDITEDRLDQLDKAIDDLKEPQLSCVKLFYLQQKSYQEIAVSLGMEINKVKSAIQNGKRNLRLKLEGIYEK